MPIKEIMTFSIGVLATLFITHGPLHFKSAIRETQMHILREVGRTDNWGNPSIFQYQHHKHDLKNKTKY